MKTTRQRHRSRKINIMGETRGQSQLIKLTVVCSELVTVADSDQRLSKRGSKKG